MVAPLKLNGTGGDLKEMTTAEENYIAYLAGLEIANTSNGFTNMGDLYVGVTKSIGTYANTFYNEAVGTHPGSSLSIGTTNKNLAIYPISNGTFDASVVDLRCLKFTTGGIRIDEFSADETYDHGVAVLDPTKDETELFNRLLSTIMSNEYPSVYRLATTTPGADWTNITNLDLVDTRSDGTSITYAMWRRTALSAAPTTVRPLKLADVSGNLKEMTDTEIRNGIGRKIRYAIFGRAKIENNGGVGSYQLRTSGEGAPTAPGTWVARGTAIDTRNTTAEVDYILNYTTTRVADRATDYTANYVNPNAGTYTRTRIFNRYRTSSSNYVGNYVGNYLGAVNYLGNYIGNFIGDFVGDFTGNYIGTTLSSSSATVETYTLYCRTA